MKIKRTKAIPETKLKIVRELADLMKNKKTLLVASIKNIPASQYQEISKKLRGKALVKVLKKNLVFRAIDTLDNKELSKIKEKIEDSIALLFSDLDSYDLATELLQSKSPSKAKPGQEAPMDIEIPEGPTDLVPGPAISELGALGIQIKIDKGKINIKQAKVIAKEGEKISQGAADLMSKLDIKPFSIGFEPVLAYDTKENKLYLEMKIDREATVEELKTNYGKSLAFAVEIGYIAKDTITFILGKASMHGKAIEGLVGEEKEEEKPEEVIDNKESQSEGDNNKVETIEQDKSKEKVVEEPKEEVADNKESQSEGDNNKVETIEQDKSKEKVVEEKPAEDNAQSDEKFEEKPEENK